MCDFIGLYCTVTDLLGFVKAMYLVDEQNGLSLKQTELVLGLFDDLSHVAGGRTGGRERHEASCAFLLNRTGHNMSQSGL